jgi:hypothetical protein
MNRDVGRDRRARQQRVRAPPEQGRRVMFAVCTVLIATALVAVLLAVVYGLASPTRTPASCLRALVANTREGIAPVRVLKPK